MIKFHELWVGVAIKPKPSAWGPTQGLKKKLSGQVPNPLFKKIYKLE